VITLLITWLIMADDGVSFAARRFHKQILLSVDVAPGLMSMGNGSSLPLYLEEAVLQTLKELENQT
jgi:hypothetical protein